MPLDNITRTCGIAHAIYMYCDFFMAVKLVIVNEKRMSFLIFAQNINCGYMLDSSH